MATKMELTSSPHQQQHSPAGVSVTKPFAASGALVVLLLPFLAAAADDESSAWKTLLVRKVIASRQST